MRDLIWPSRRWLAAFLTIAPAVLLAAGCSSAGLTPTTPTTTNSVTITASPPTFIVGVAGNINVKLAGSPTKTSSFKLDFGDQSSATLSAVTSAEFAHSYAATGTFKVTATVTGSDGSVASGAAEVSVLP